MSAEPLTDEQLERVGAAAEALVAAWSGRDEAMLITPLVMAAWGERIARVDVPALLASHQLLADRLADARVQATLNYKVVAPILVAEVNAAEARAERLLAELNRLTADVVPLRTALTEIAEYCRKRRCDDEPGQCPSARARQALGGAR